jgi:DNA-binding MltR family transcriptional regulator
VDNEMSKKQFKKIMIDFPAPEELKDIITGLRESNDHSSVLVATSIIENSLKSLITASFKNTEKKLMQYMFDNNGPLSSLWAKNMTAYALGLIEGGTRQEIDNIRLIRNLFAHSPRPIRFVDESVSSFVFKFKTISAIENFRADEISSKTDAKSMFFLTFEILIIYLDFKICENDGMPIYVSKSSFQRVS